MPIQPLTFSPTAQPVDSTLDAAVPAVLSGYPAPLLRQCHVSPVATGGFSEARVWRLTADAGMFALRATRDDQVDLARLRGLHRLLEQVRAAGIDSSPAPLRHADGTTFGSFQAHIWQLEPWMPGNADFHEQPSPARLTNAMTVLARWHLAAERFCCEPAEAPWFLVQIAPSPSLNERREQLREWLAGEAGRVGQLVARDSWQPFRELGLRLLEIFPRVAPRILDELSIAAPIPVRLQPCLRDIWHDHVLFTGDDVTGLIDAHACRSESVAGDLARLLGSLVEDDRAAWDVGLTAYQQVRPLDLTERGLVELFDRSAVTLSGLTWLKWRTLEQRPCANGERVLERLARIVARLERLAGAPS